MTVFTKTIAALALACLTSFANAAEVKLGDLTIMNPEIPATPKSAPVSAGYLMIKNNGSEDDRLVSAQADFAGKVEIHGMEMVEGVMRMRPEKGGVVIPAGGSVVLKKGGLHIMFMKLQEQMAEGESRKVALTFKNAGSITVDMDVVKRSAGANHSGHSDGHGDGHDKKHGEKHSEGHGDGHGHSDEHGDEKKVKSDDL